LSDRPNLAKWLPIYRDQLPTTLPAFIPVKTTPRRATEEMAIISLPLGDKFHRKVASLGSGRLRVFHWWPGPMILATEPMEMRAGTETALARVVAVFPKSQRLTGCSR
jgi:hypothetical protein